MVVNEMRQHLTERILPFWERLTDWTRGGWYGYVDKDLVVHKDAHKGCILNSRVLWTFATAARVLGEEKYLDYARHALRFMGRFEDYQRGGLYWSVTPDGFALDKTKHTYCQAFAIYGLAAYMRAAGKNDPLYETARERAFRLFDVIETRCCDAGGYGEAYEPDFVPVDNKKLSDNPTLMERGEVAERTMNTLLHVLEAYAEFYRAIPEERVLKAGKACLERFLHVMYNAPKRRLEVFYDRDYRSLLDMQSYGHDIEASWLMWDAVETFIPEKERAPYRDMCLTLAEATCERAFTDHGMENEIVEGVVEHTRVWWVQAETVLGFAQAYALTGEEAWMARLCQQWAYIQREIVDPREGSEWFWSTDENGVPTDKPIVEEWKCPYHNGRMCLRLIEKHGEG
ncbi:MAG: AGE family epimerase/isomerase [Clostridiales bacterium]|nr:AGE family epimerase/isomerase [Clostridiales bacterium]